MDKLLPCPFCNAPGRFVSAAGMAISERFSWHVCCGTTGCMMQFGTGQLREKALAAEAWNHRAPAPPPEAVKGGEWKGVGDWLDRAQALGFPAAPTQAEAVKADPGAPAKEENAKLRLDLCRWKALAKDIINRLEKAPWRDQGHVCESRQAVEAVLNMARDRAAALPTGADPRDLGKDGEPSAPRALREPKTALVEAAWWAVQVLRDFRLLIETDLGKLGDRRMVHVKGLRRAVDAGEKLRDALSARSAPKPKAEGSPSSLPAPSPGETALDLEALKDAAWQLRDAVMEYEHADGSITHARCVNACIGVDRALAALAATPVAQESRPLTWTREKPTAPGLYRVRKHKFVSSAEVWTHPSFGRSFDMNCEDLSPHDPEIEWCGPYPEPQTLSEGGAI